MFFSAKSSLSLGDGFLSIDLRSLWLVCSKTSHERFFSEWPKLREPRCILSGPLLLKIGDGLTTSLLPSLMLRRMVGTSSGKPRFENTQD
jgi:hypothetical protein